MNDSASEHRSIRERLEQYESRIRIAEAEVERLSARSRLVSNLRGLSFGAGVICLITALSGTSPELTAPLAIAALATFAVLVLVHARVIDAQDLAERRVDVNRDAAYRLRHEFRSLSDTGEGLCPADHAYAADLDLFGSGSLFQRLSVARTRFGRERLAQLLLAPSPLEEARRRQQAVRALAADLELRQNFEAHALGLSGVRRDRDAKIRVRSAPNPEPLLRWAESSPTLLFDPLSVWGARIVPVLTLAAVVGHVSFDTPLSYVGLSLVLHVFLILRSARETGRVFNAVSSAEGAFLRYGTLLEIIENLDTSDPLLRGLKERLRTGKGLPSEAMARFRRWVGWFDLRHNGLAHVFVNLFTLWDIHCTVGLERWQQAAGKQLREWFDVIGWFEALSSFASFAADEPGLCYPELIEDGARFEASGLAHPLLDPDRRVANDVVLPGPGSALLITGSNMSGKSTLLRSMGVATVLALAGAPVTAQRLRISRLTLCTSIRIADSLERGISHFFAEILRLKSVVDAARGDYPVLFLLDEVLHGTNSRERQIGARWLLAELLRRGALGAISTHDQELCRLPDELMEKVSLVHLRESVENGQMTFDYRVYPGPVVSGNALRLMRQVGLEVPLE